MRIAMKPGERRVLTDIAEGRLLDLNKAARKRISGQKSNILFAPSNDSLDSGSSSTDASERMATWVTESRQLDLIKTAISRWSGLTAYRSPLCQPEQPGGTTHLSGSDLSLQHQEVWEQRPRAPAPVSVQNA